MAKPNEATSTARAAAGRGRVLLVEDDNAVRSLARRVLQNEGFTVVEARTGEEGLARWVETTSRGEAIDVVVTDIVMPDLGGRELVTRLRAGNPRLPVVYVSSYFADAVSSLDLSGPAELVEKPFTPAALTTAVHTVLGYTGEPDQR
jgi:CheY-like chemotaxis protein